MCSELTPAQKAMHGMVQDIRKEYGGSGGAKKKFRAATGGKVKYECCVCLLFLLYYRIVPRIMLRRLLLPRRCQSRLR